MSATDRPTVLIIDDHADDERAKLRPWEADVELTVRHPQDVDEADLRAADVVVIDYVLDDWPERDATATISLRPPDGLALAAVLRGYAEKLAGSPTAFVLRSAHLPELTSGFPPDTRLHVIAQQQNLEWVLDKNDALGRQTAQIRSLSAAVKSLPEVWPSDDADATRLLVEQWLALPDQRWRHLAWQDIEDCHPPWHQLVERRHGLRFVRWFAQRILPYPCFLWSQGRLAARLRVTPESLQDGLSKGLVEVFRQARYVGQLHDFLGDRWWQSGCEAILWDHTDGNSFDSEEILSVLNRHCGGVLVRSPVSEPVLCIDTNFNVGAEVCEIADAVRIQPDEWPPYAEQAWAPLQLSRENARVRSGVIAMDRERLVEQGDTGSEVE